MKRILQPTLIFDEGDREPIVLWPEEPAARRPYDFTHEDEDFAEAV